jgi:hypothetical protein
MYSLLSALFVLVRVIVIPYVGIVVSLDAAYSVSLILFDDCCSSNVSSANRIVVVLCHESVLLKGCCLRWNGQIWTMGSMVKQLYVFILLFYVGADGCFGPRG